MSSHHFVKEGQEPALVIAEVIPLSQVEPLLEWAPLIIVLEQSLAQALAWGIKIDIVVIAENTPLAPIQQQMAHQLPIAIERCPANVDMLAMVLRLARAASQQSVNVCITNPELYFDLAEISRLGMEIALIDEALKWSAIPSGKFRKWLPKGSVLQISLKTDFKITQGKVKINENQVFTIEDAFVEIESESVFWIGERSN